MFISIIIGFVMFPYTNDTPRQIYADHISLVSSNSSELILRAADSVKRKKFSDLIIGSN